MYHDTRMFGDGKWYYTSPKDADMRTPNELLKSVVFLSPHCEKTVLFIARMNRILCSRAFRGVFKWAKLPVKR